MSLNPQATYVLLTAEGTAAPLPGGDEFWALPDTELAATGAGWLVSEFLFTSDWPSWEMHPHADEFVYLISGEATLHLEQAEGVKVIVLSGSGAVIVPRGVWHTARISAPSRMLHVTRGSGTQIRPV